MTTRPVDDYLTHEQLADHVGGAEQLANILPATWAGSSTKARQLAADLVVKSLKRRTPPVHEADLSDLEELRDAVTYAALEYLYSLGMTSSDGHYAIRRRLYQDRLEDELNALTPTVGDGESAGASWAIERR
jgi:hypothetical protein